MKKRAISTPTDKKMVTASVIVTLCGFILMLYVAFMPNALNRQIYIRNFTANNAVEQANLPQETLDMLIDRSLAYSYGSIPELQIQVTDLDGHVKDAFTEREILHMKDVQLLFLKGRLLAAVSALLFAGGVIYLATKHREIKKRTINAALITLSALLAVMVALLIIVACNFDAAFVTFHEIFFNNDLWLLDWDTVLIITMPEEAFFEVTLRTLIIFIILTGLEYTGLLLLKRRLKKQLVI